MVDQIVADDHRFAGFSGVRSVVAAVLIEKSILGRRNEEIF